MIKLDEKDVKALAVDRFLRRNKKTLLMVCGGFLVLALGLALACYYLSWPNEIFFIALGLFVSLCILLDRLETKAKKELLKEWRSE